MNSLIAYVICRFIKDLHSGVGSKLKVGGINLSKKSSQAKKKSLYTIIYNIT